MTIGELIRTHREQQGISQQALAETVGVSRTYLGQIERGEAEYPSFFIVMALADALGIRRAVLEFDRDGSIPSALARVANALDLPPDDVEMLRQICYRGAMPYTPEGWRLIYRAIQAATEFPPL